MYCADRLIQQYRLSNEDGCGRGLRWSWESVRMAGASGG